MDSGAKGKKTEYANSVFEQPWWLDIVAEGTWGECKVERNGKVIARLPYVLDGKQIRNPKLTQTLGIWMDDSLKKPERGNSHLFKQKEVIGELLEQLPANKGISLTLDHSVKYILPFRWHGFCIEPMFSYRIEYDRSMEEVKGNFAKHIKRDILKAENRGLNVAYHSKEYDTFLHLLDLTFERQKRKNPMDAEMVKKILSQTSETGHGELMLAKDAEGNTHSGAFFLYDENVCYYLLGGQDPRYKDSSSQELLLCRGIEFGAEVARAFDFEGSMVEGIEHFFRRFGGEQVVNYHISRQPFFYEVMEMMKPRIKKWIGYKV